MSRVRTPADGASASTGRGAIRGKPNATPPQMYNRFSTMTEVRNALWPSYETPEYDEAHFLQGIAGTLELFHRSALAFPGTGRRSHRPPGRRLPAHRPGGVQAADRRADPRRHRHPDGVRARPHPVASKKPHPRRSAPSGSGCSEKAPACCWPRITTSASPTISRSVRSNTSTTATRSCRASSGSASTPAH